MRLDPKTKRPKTVPAAALGAVEPGRLMPDPRVADEDAELLASPALDVSEEEASETQPYRIVLRCRTKRTKD